MKVQTKLSSLKILILQVVCFMAVLFSTLPSLFEEIVVFDEIPIRLSFGWWAVSAIPVLVALHEFFHRDGRKESV